MSSTKIMKSIGWVGLASIFNSVQTVLLVPILLSKWGNGNFAAWISINSIIALFRMFETGHQYYVGNKLNMEYSIDLKAFKTTLSSGFVMAIFISLIQITSLSIYVLSIDRPEWMYRNEDAIALILFASAMCIVGLIKGYLGRLYIAYGDFDLNIKWVITYQVLQLIILVLLVLSDFEILEVCITIGITQLIIAVFQYLSIKEKYGDNVIYINYFSAKQALQDFNKSTVVSVITQVNQSSSNAIVLLMNLTSNMIMIPVFSAVRTISNFYLQALQLITQPLEPELAKLYVTRKYKRLVSIFALIWMFTGLIVNLILVIINPLIEEIFNVWTLGKIKLNLIFYICMIITVLLKNFGMPINLCLENANMLRLRTFAILGQIATMSLIIIFNYDAFDFYVLGVAYVAAEIISSLIIPVAFVYLDNNFRSNKEFRQNMIVAFFSFIIMSIFMVVVILAKINQMVSTLIGISLSMLIFFTQYSIGENAIKKKIKVILFGWSQQ